MNVGIMEKTIKILENENWWGGVVAHSYMMPFNAQSDYELDLETVVTNMQINPLFVSDKGRSIWCEKSYKISFKNGYIHLSSDNDVIFNDSNKNLSEVHAYCYENYFEKDDDKLPNDMFTAPTYCTWAKFFKNQNEDGILEYAQSILDAGLEPGMFIIDGSWQTDFGDWRFFPGRFKDPKGMIDKLKAMGFKVVMWIFPFITSAGDIFLDAERKGVLLKDHNGKPKIIRWWSGYSPVLDLLNPDAEKYFKERLEKVTNDYGTYGFKYDGGHMYMYQDAEPYGGAKAEDECREFTRYGKLYPYSEVRNTFGNGGLKMMFRMADRHHSWDIKMGLKSIVPCQIVMGLLGYPFSCPDMLGGGEINNFKKNQENLSLELFIRFAECSAFAPILQLSYDFWASFDKNTAGICTAYSSLRSRNKDFFLSLKKECEETNKPMIRSLAYETGKNSEVMDEHFFGSSLLVAPVVDEGKTERDVVLPEGKWLYYDREYEGGRTVTVKAPIGVLPVFERVGSNVGIHKIIKDALKDNGVDFDKLYN